MPIPSKLSPRKQLYLLTCVHAVVDTYATVLPHVLPLLLKKLVSQTSARNSYAGVLISVFSNFGSLGQLPFGWLSDRVRTVHILTFGIAVSATGMSLLGIAPSFSMLLLLVAVGGSGIAAFHPQATAQAAALSKQNTGFGVSLFLMGGNFGRAAGPLAIMYLLVYRYGLEGMVWCMIPGLLIALIVPSTLKTPFAAPPISSQRAIGAPAPPEKRKELWQVMRPNLRTFLVLYLIAVLRTITAIGFENFLSLHLDDQQYSNPARSAVIALFLIAGSIGIMIGGWLSDRIHRYGLLLFSLLAAPPFLYTSLHSSGGMFLILLFIGNFILSSSITVNIVLGQQLLPEHENIASGVMMGAAWGVGGLLITPVGVLSDYFGLPKVLDGLAMLPLITAALMIFLKRGQKQA